MVSYKGCQNRHRQIDNPKAHIVVNMTPFRTSYDNLVFCVTHTCTSKEVYNSQDVSKKSGFYIIIYWNIRRRTQTRSVPDQLPLSRQLRVAEPEAGSYPAISKKICSYHVVVK